MPKKARRKAPKKLTRNPLARALAAPTFRNRVVPTKVEAYKRRPKHIEPPEDET